MRIFCLALVFAVVAVPSRASREDDAPNAAYRLGASAHKVALLPVQCTRGMEHALCSQIDESLAVELARDSRLEILAPRDLEVLLGAQQLVELSNCEKEDCFDPSAFTQLEAHYLLSAAIGRIGGDAKITIRLVDLKRGVVIDRDDARAWHGSEEAIDKATCALAQSILVRRGVGSPTVAAVDDDGGNPLLFWSGAGATGLGVLGLVAGGAIGSLAYIEARSLQQSSGVAPAVFDATASRARDAAFGADIALVGGGLITAVGVTLMLAGSL
ncbi:MAG: hypothetical protein Q8O67_25535 [Deltaproteobacteria bacterium]|nr:hypothetical protein [Deltaproteobacteria bacterium]